MATTTADRIRNRRLALKLSQTDLATRMDRPRALISQWETGRRAPSTIESVTDLCKALNCSADYLFGLSKRA